MAETNRAPFFTPFATHHTHGYVREILPLKKARRSTMDTDDDGPCAVPQPDAIQESFADPLAVFGSALLATSLLLMLFTATRRGNWRCGHPNVTLHYFGLFLQTSQYM